MFGPDGRSLAAAHKGPAQAGSRQKDRQHTVLLQAGVFALVAGLAKCLEVIQPVGAAVEEGNNMIHHEIASISLAYLALVPITLEYQEACAHRNRRATDGLLLRQSEGGPAIVRGALGPHREGRRPDQRIAPCAEALDEECV